MALTDGDSTVTGRVWLFLLAGLLPALCLASPVAMATTTQDADGRLDLVVEVYRLGSAVSMFVLDNNGRAGAYREDALRSMRRIDEKMSGPDAGKALSTGRQVPPAPALVERWERLRKTVYVDDRSGILVQGYTPESFMKFVVALRAVRASLADSLSGNISDEQELRVLVSSSVSNYLLFSADPDGAFDRNYDEGEDNVPATVSRVDDLISDLSYSAKNPEYRNRIRAARNSWGYLRMLLNNGNEAMAPWGVYGVGSQLIDSLQDRSGT